MVIGCILVFTITDVNRGGHRDPERSTATIILCPPINMIGGHASITPTERQTSIGRSSAVSALAILGVFLDYLTRELAW